jgi:hypothetical protein
MTVEQSAAAPNARAARISSVVFAAAGVVAVVGGAASILLGVPSPARDLAPVSGPGDVFARLGEFGPLLAALVGALVAGAVAVLLARRRLDARATALQFAVLGLAVDACVAGSIGRVGYAVDGSVLPAAIVCLMGGSFLIGGGIVASLGRERGGRP